ncbi:MAG TPA: FAD-dependent oxidoreductase, partial [Egibacteraceae bacterium]|nr:FAD-dependent oxidoreductase [Egibacteraceae bacterium]
MRTSRDEKAGGGQSVETPLAAGSTAVVVGAGLAGLVCAYRLAAAGVDVAVVERESQVGGRLATERLAGATFDHGAQFFTIRDERFATLVDDWRAAGLQVGAWCHGFARAASVRADAAAA